MLLTKLLQLIFKDLTKKVFISADNIITTLGFDTKSNVQNLLEGKTGIKLHNDSTKSQTPLWASLIDNTEIETQFSNSKVEGNYTRLEKLFILSIKDALKNSGVDAASPRTLVVLSSAKGNIDLLGTHSTVPSSVHLTSLGRTIQHYFNNPNTPVIVSNGCISGVLALITASRLIEAGRYDHIIVSGGDIISEFTISGFQSFKALSDEACKPFDKTRNGLNLGEGCATIILTSDEKLTTEESIQIVGGATSNDANHISGPSRTGEGLLISINKALKEAKGFGVERVGYISAHGTATAYNDEMESLAFASAMLEKTPINSLKGYFGHTLGAAGLIESAITLSSLKNNMVFASKGFDAIGVTGPVNIIKKSEKLLLKACLKTASGFGGCNAAIIFKKNE